MQKIDRMWEASIFANRRSIWLNRAPLHASRRATAGGVIYVHMRVLFGYL